MLLKSSIAPGHAVLKEAPAGAARPYLYVSKEHGESRQLLTDVAEMKTAVSFRTNWPPSAPSRRARAPRNLAKRLG